VTRVDEILAPSAPADATASGASTPAVDRHAAARQARVGLLSALGAYLAWGFIPLFFKLVAHVPPIVVLSHRIIWSALFVGGILTAQHRWGEVVAAVRNRRTLLALTFSTIAIAINWFVFLWAITNRQVMQAGLGYFINPLVSVLLGMIFLRERLRGGQAAALLLATAGVLVQVVARGQFPWVALTLAWSFAFYALLRKTAHVGPLVGLFIETALLVPMSAYFVARFSAGNTALTGGTYTLLALSGVITAVPLLLFATAARRLTMATLGFLQFLSPTCQLLLAVFAFGEPFTRWHAISFGLIWLALALYSLESLHAYRKPQIRTPADAVECAEV
jgi:chloramphenicol-sensitive protein RarD